MECIRCCGRTAFVVAAAPDGSNAWEVYYCDTCNFSWRSTEEREVITREERDPYFQLIGVDLRNLMSPTPIPPLVRNK